jgi:hypothetical protein
LAAISLPEQQIQISGGPADGLLAAGVDPLTVPTKILPGGVSAMARIKLRTATAPDN